MCPSRERRSLNPGRNPNGGPSALGMEDPRTPVSSSVSPGLTDIPSMLWLAPTISFRLSGENMPFRSREVGAGAFQEA